LPGDTTAATTCAPADDCCIVAAGITACAAKTPPVTLKANNPANKNKIPNLFIPKNPKKYTGVILRSLSQKRKLTFTTPDPAQYHNLMDSKHYVDFAKKIAKKAGEILLDYYQTNIQINFKGGDKRNLVTEVDLLSEKLIVDAIKKEFPDHCFMAEEGGDCGIKPSEYKWVIDPVDGTTNYAHGYNFYAVSIALMRNNEVLAGVIYAPMLNEMFSAAKGHGAFLNDKPLHVSKTEKLETSLLATGFNANEKGRNLPIFKHVLPKSQGIRRAGSAALDMAYTAAGRLDGYWEFAIYPWDIAAGVIIIQEAGGTVTDLEGKPLNLSAPDHMTILSTNGKIHAEMVKEIGDGNR